MALAIALAVIGPSAASADLSPEAQTAVNRAVAYLGQHGEDDRLGGTALAGRVMLALGRANDPVVERAVTAVRARSANPGRTDIYSLGLAIIFLVELDPTLHELEIRRLVDHLVGMQKGHGGWGYAERPTGDTSMTQYAVFGLWMAEQAGIPAPIEVWEKAANWLLRTQDPGGAWAYQGTDSGGPELVAQSGPTRNMTVAAVGSLYFCGHRLGLLALQVPPRQVHPLFEVSVPLRAAATLQTDRVDPTRFQQALARGLRAIDAQNLPIRNDYYWYYLYSIERYQSLREAHEDRWPREPAWYTDGASTILARQARDGSWNGSEGPIPATCFAVLFLLRSTRHVIEQVRGLGAGTLVGGRGLPSGSGQVEIRLGQIETPPTTGPAETLIDRIENPFGEDLGNAAAALVELPIVTDQPLESHLAARLRTLAGSDQPAARAAALTALGRTGDLSHAALLIDGLRDADPIVHRAAWQALRWMRRRPAAEPPPRLDTPSERALEAGKWKDWLMSVRPESAGDF